jgi:hypothetical protein
MEDLGRLFGQSGPSRQRPKASALDREAAGGLPGGLAFNEEA